MNNAAIIQCASCTGLIELSFNLTAGGAPKLEGETSNVVQMDSFPTKCPHCKKLEQVQVRIEILSVKESDACLPKPSRMDGLSAPKRNLYKKWDELGLLDILEEALNRVNPGQRTNLVKFVFRFIADAQPVYPSRAYVEEASGMQCDTRGEFTHRLQCWQYGDIVGIVINGYLRGFVPAKIFSRKNPITLTGKGHGVGSAAHNRILKRFDYDEGWVKTRFGYVAGRGAFFDELMSQGRAAWGDATRKQRA